VMWSQRANTLFRLPKFISGSLLEEDRFWFCS
jgi:hypothetical protein